MISIGVDPGKTKSAMVVMDGTKLLAIGWVDSYLECCSLLQGVVLEGAIGTVEGQRHYPNTPKSVPNDLIDLGNSAGRMLGYLESLGVACTLPKPQAWKGTVPKSVHNKRVIEKVGGEPDWKAYGIRSSDGHHFLDAIGLSIFGTRQNS